jgi:hypothetical protein
VLNSGFDLLRALLYNKQEKKSPGLSEKESPKLLFIIM